MKNVSSPALVGMNRGGPRGWTYYPAMALGDMEDVSLLSLLALNKGVFSEGVLQALHRFPAADATAAAIDDVLADEYQGTLISDYLKAQVANVMRSFDTDFTADRAEQLLVSLNTYMTAAPRLHAEISSELAFHKRSLETILAAPITAAPEDVSESERLIAAMMQTTISPAWPVHVEKATAAKEQLNFLSPIVNLIEDVIKLMKRDGSLS